MKMVAHIPPVEVVAHRVIWSVPIAGAILLLMRRTDALMTALKSPRTLLMACVTAALVSINWGIYVWSIATDRALDAALGYYINPLFSIALAAILLGEKLTRLQWVAVALAAAAVGVLWLDAGTLPWAALTLTVSWGFYAFFKKSLPIGPNQGFLLEVLILSIPATLYLLADRAGAEPFSARHAGHLASVGLWRGHGGAAFAVCQWRQTAAFVDHRHHAIYCAHDDFSRGCDRVQRAVWPSPHDRLSDDLGGLGDLFNPDVSRVPA
jgi:RarD protein